MEALTTIVDKESNEFQQTIFRSIEQHTAPYLVKLNGTDYVMFPETFNPNYAKASLFLLDNLGVKKGDVVLDTFTGCGADAIFAVLQGAERAVAIDQFTMPYLCARYNAYRLGLDDKIDVRQGDLFEPLEDGEKFSLVIANPPFKDAAPSSITEAALKDEDYLTLSRFFGYIGDYLKPQGRIRLVFSDVGKTSYLQQLIIENGFESKTIARTTYASNVSIEIYEITRLGDE